MYVGSAIVGRMGNRFHKHLYDGSGSILVWAAALKYGLSNFAFVVLDTVHSVPFFYYEEENKELLYREYYYMNLLGPIYNIAPQAGNTFGVKQTEETKSNMRLNYSSERREAIGSLNRGNILSPETVKAMQKSALVRSPSFFLFLFS